MKGFGLKKLNHGSFVLETFSFNTSRELESLVESGKYFSVGRNQHQAFNNASKKVNISIAKLKKEIDAFIKEKSKHISSLEDNLKKIMELAEEYTKNKY